MNIDTDMGQKVICSMENLFTHELALIGWNDGKRIVESTINCLTADVTKHYQRSVAWKPNLAPLIIDCEAGR